MLPLNALAGWFGDFECLVDVLGHIWLRFRAGQVLGICWFWLFMFEWPQFWGFSRLMALRLRLANLAFW